MSKVTVIEHPLIHHKMAILRDKHTGSKAFREVVNELALLVAYEVTRDFPLVETEIETPITTGTFKVLANEKVAVIPVLRAGLGMVDGILSVIPNAKIGHIGLYRDHETLQPTEYYCKLPDDIAERICIVVDPMLATGNSANEAIQLVKNRGGKNIRFVCLLAAPPGIEALQKEHPDVDIYIACQDGRLNEHGYIVPGLGDAGDRLFGTK